MAQSTDETGRRFDPGGQAARDYAFRVYAIDDADEIRFRDLWDAVWRGKWIIGGAAFGAAILAGVLTFLMTPEYRSTVLVAPITENAGGSGLASLATQFAGVAALTGVNLTSGTRTAEAVATLRSRAFTEKFIREHNLMPVLFADRWDPQARRWTVERDEVPTLWDGFARFDAIRSVEEDVETGLISVDVDWTDPRLAAEWANGLIADVNLMLRTRAIRESQQNLDFLRTELEKSSQVPLQTSIYGLIEAEMKNAMLANVRQEYAFRVIDPAIVPERMSWPNRLLITLLGFCAGLVIGTFVAAMKAPAGH